jgi:capsular polysaccharide biosynthesis protein
MSLKFFALLVILRFSAIVFVYSSQFMYDALLQNEYQKATQVITMTKEELETIQKQNREILKSKKETGFFHSLDSKYKSIVDSLNISKQLDALQASIDEATRNIITLITVFVFQTVLFPLFYLWIVLWLVRWLFGYENDKLKLLYNNQNQ